MRLSEPNFLSAPEVPGTEIGAHPLLKLFNFLPNKQKTSMKIFLRNRLFIGLLDHCFQPCDSPISELDDHGTVLLAALEKIQQKPK